MSLLRAVGYTLIAVVLHASSPQDRTLQDAAALTDADASALARQARDALLRVTEDPDDSAARQAGLDAFRRLFGSDGWGGFSPETTSMAGSALRLVTTLAGKGDAPCHEAVMRASLGPYGRKTAEGSEWLNEILWNLLTSRTQDTLDLLLRFEPEDRAWLVEHVYTTPVRDDFDFAEILERLDECTPPTGLEGEVKRIREAVESNAPGPASPR